MRASQRRTRARPLCDVDMVTVTSRIYRFLAETQEAAAQQTEVQTKRGDYAVILAVPGTERLILLLTIFQSSQYKGAGGLLDSQGKNFRNRYRAAYNLPNQGNLNFQHTKAFIINLTPKGPGVRNVYRSDGRRAIQNTCLSWNLHLRCKC
jgi:hypothetical protein